MAKIDKEEWLQADREKRLKLWSTANLKEIHALWTILSPAYRKELLPNKQDLWSKLTEQEISSIRKKLEIAVEYDPDTLLEKRKGRLSHY